MDTIDEKILSLLEGKPKKFEELLSKVGYSHNTLRLHLDKLAEERVISKDKLPSEGRGRPTYTYSAAQSSRRPSMARLNESTGVVSLSFDKLSQICRFEKGGFCKKVRGECYASDCPQIR